MSVKITRYSHYIKVHSFEDKVKQYIYHFISAKLTSYETVRMSTGEVIRTVDKRYATAPIDHSEFRFHASMEQEVIDWLRGYGVNISRDMVETAPIPEPRRVVHEIREEWVPNDMQVPGLEYVMNTDYRSKMLPAQTGSGKTALAIFAMQRMGVASAVIVKSSLGAQWVKDYLKQTHAVKGDVELVKGRASLLSCIYKAQAGELTAKLIVFSSGTLQGYMKDWEATQGSDDRTPMSLEDVFALLGLGLIIQDEWHLAFHLNFKLDLYTHVANAIKLSATVNPEDAFLAKMFEVAVPSEERFKGIPYNKYVHVIAFSYSMNNPHRLKMTPRGRTSYSHKKFEESLISRPRMLEDYLDIITDLVRQGYVLHKDFEPGMKAIIFADTKDMCTAITDRLKETWPEIDIRRKVGDDPEANMYESTIVVTTPGSAGVGTDIPDLFFGLCTISISSAGLKEQMKGRMRVMKNFPGKQPFYTYLYCKDIPKHVEYHRKTLDDYRGKCLTHIELLISGIRVG